MGVFFFFFKKVFGIVVVYRSFGQRCAKVTLGRKAVDFFVGSEYDAMKREGSPCLVPVSLCQKPFLIKV